MSNKKNILVIDDEEAVRRSFELALEDCPYTVTTVDRGKKGIEAIKNKPYDLVFLDLKMPEMNGVETLQGIREQNLEVPVYIVTAFYKEFLSELEAVRQAGLVFQLLRKPLGNVEIQAVVEGVLDNPTMLV